MPASIPSKRPRPRVEVSVVIDRSVDEVFEFVSRLENMSIWDG